MRTQIVEEAFEFALHRIHLFAHIEDDLHTSEIDAKITSKGEDYFEAFEVAVGIKSGITIRTRRLEKTFSFIKPQRLRMYVIHLRNRADSVCLSSLLHILRVTELQSYRVTEFQK